MKKVLMAIVGLALVSGVALAGGLEQGDREVAIGLSYQDVDFGVSGGFDRGSNENTELELSCGWLVTDRHEFGLLVGYQEVTFKGDELFDDSSEDGTQFGGFYNYNLPAGELLTPYAGVAFNALGGDLGDKYDFSYTAELGLKIYPFEHGGFSVGVSYTELRADGQDRSDADGISLGVGLLLKF